MKRALVMFVTALAALATSAPADDLPRPKPILEFARGEGCPPARLSPGGEQLLYVHAQAASQPADDGRPRRLYRLALLDIKSGKEKLLPMAAFTWDDPLAIMVSKPIFHPKGKQIVFGQSTDANDNGVHDELRRGGQGPGETIRPAIYDSESGKVRKLPLEAPVMLPMFDRSGAGLVIGAGEKGKAFHVYWQENLDAQPRQLKVDGVPMAVSPTEDLAVVWVLPPGKKEGPTQLVLYDLKKDQQVAELAINPKNSLLDDYSPQFTADGRYVYYPDVKDDARQSRMTRVWDVKTGKEAAVVDDATPISPGPDGSMVLATSRGPTAGCLHDPAKNALKPLAVPANDQIAFVGSGKVVIVHREDGKSQLIIEDMKFVEGK